MKQVRGRAAPTETAPKAQAANNQDDRHADEVSKRDW